MSEKFSNKRTKRNIKGGCKNRDLVVREVKKKTKKDIEWKNKDLVVREFKEPDRKQELLDLFPL